jgi:molybdenum cofactor biosynthesis enzyme MoaA
LTNTKCLAVDQAISITNAGKISPCCQIRHDEFQFVDASSIEKYKNSKWLANIRSTMDQGLMPSECHECYNSEALGMPSMRTYLNDRLSNSGLLEYLDLRLGNVCNSDCAMCHPDCSSKIEHRIVTTKNLNIFPTYLIDSDITVTTQNKKWYNQDLFFDWFKTQAGNLKVLKFLGGEPFLVENIDVWTDWLIQQGYSNKITLHFNTNASILNQERMFLYIKKFKRVVIHASADGIDDCFNYIRHGLSWKSVEKNILKYREYSSAFHNKFNITVSCVVQPYNLLYLIDLLKWNEQYNIDIAWIFPTTPEYLKLQNFENKKIIQSTIETLDKFKQETKTQSTTVNALISHLTDCLEINSYPPGEFIDYTDYMNSFRSLKFDSKTLQLQTS